VRRALDEERLVLYAQPIVELASGVVTQHELLLRMLGDDGEVILPGTFLPVAERRGMISLIDRWVVRQAVQALAERPADHPRSLLQINMSGRSLSDPELCDYVADQLRVTGADPAQLVIEITETAAIGDMDPACIFLAKLSALGCAIALDGFGSGCGSFQYLRKLPFEYLKIDGEFIKDLTTDPDDLVLVESLVGVARLLRKRTVAEFVENAATLRLVRELGIDFAQGYYVGPPTPMKRRVSTAPLV
jgi:EAL domain-containing protein (putative c-di-GMP-specific phosphodiesterase class I)